MVPCVVVVAVDIVIDDKAQLCDSKGFSLLLDDFVM